MQVLLDEINLASADTLQRIAALLEGPSARFQLPEGGGSVDPHPMFRLFGAMNPANDAGKRDLPPALRARFTELWVEDPSDPVDIAGIVSSCLSHIPGICARTPSNSEGSASIEEDDSDIINRVVKCYLDARALAEPRTGAALRDGSGGRPHYSIRRSVRRFRAPFFLHYFAAILCAASRVRCASLPT